MEGNYLKSITMYYAGRDKCEPGYYFGPAIRQHYLLHVVLEGKGIYRRNSHIYEMKKGDAFLIIPGDKCYYRADDEEPWEYAWIGFDGYEVPGILKDCRLTSENPVFHGGVEEEWLSIIKELVDNYYSYSRNDYKVLGYVYFLFAYMSREAKHLNVNSYEKEYLNLARDYMQKNYEWNIRIEDIAKMAGIDRSYLYRLFMKEENMSPKQYLTEIRLQAAMYMLANGKEDIMEVAMRCGFRDSSSFCRIFKEHYHKTPKRFRVEQRAEHIDPDFSDSEYTFVLP